MARQLLDEVTPYASGKAPRKLEDIFGELGDIQTNLYRTQRAPVRNQKLGELAATGRLSSGIAEHSLNALDQDTALGEAQIRGATIPQIGTGILQDDSQDFQSAEAEKEFQRNMALAKSIGSMNKPSDLSQVFQGVGSIGSLVAGAYTGNPALIAGGAKGISDMSKSSDGGVGSGSNLVSMFRNPPPPPPPPNLSLFDPYATGARRYF